MEDTRAIQGPGSADVEASVSIQEEDLVASDIENEKVFSYDGQEQNNQVQETVMVHVKNEQALDESPKGYEAGEGAMEEANYGVKCLSPNDYVKYESSSSDSHAGSYLSPHGTDGKLRCDICGLACVSLNVLLVHKRSHTGERPFHCIQCGASFTQKGNLLRHIKLHSGEKPFKCHMCSYACRRRDALSGHLRTHSVEKPYKCNFCGRSYKQRSSLEEHKERCHIYIQSKNEGECEEIQGSKTEMGTERALVMDRLASNVAKRKSSMPQKFVGGPAQALPREDQAGKNHSLAGGTTLALETLVCISDAFSVQSSIGTAQSPPSKGEKRLCLDRSHSSNLIYTKEGELIQLGIHNPSLGYIGTDNMYHLIQSPQTARVPEIVPIISSAYPIPHTCSEISNDHKREMAHSYTKCQSTQGPSASYNGQDSSDANINRHPNGELWGHRSLYSLGHLLVPRPYNRLSHHHPPLHLPELYEALKSHLTVLPYEAMQVFNVENEPVGAYNCEHCHVLFLDYVMFTIHMGCHGFRDPFECNMCGHQSQDCYEFSSHIARGKHKMLFK